MQRISITNPQNIIDGTAKKYYFKLRNTGGPKGDKGDKGDTGSRGPQGEPGNAATVYVGSTTTLPVGQDATVENVGTQYNAVLNFGIPQGPRGPQGVKGDPGEPGQKGDPGQRGEKGERGTNATVYVGTTSTLNPGSQATVYNSGTDSNAVLNFGIPKGEKGDTGATGPAGQDGQNFTPTIVAELPTAGEEGKLYLTPKAHTTQTATGNPITATVAEDAGALESFQLDGDTFQQSYEGKNLCNPATFVKGRLDNGVIGYASDTTSLIIDGNSITYTTNVNYRGIVSAYIPVEPSTEYTLSRTVIGELSVSALIDAFESDSEASWITRLLTATFTTPSNCHYLRISFQNYTSGTATISNIQVEKSSSATSFEPYVGGVPSPNPDYPQTIQTVTGEQTVTVVGKNLYNPAQAFADGANRQNIRLKASVELGQTYTFNVTDDRIYACARLLNSNDSQTRSIGNLPSSHVVSFTPQEGEVAVFLDFYSGTTNVNVATYDFSGVQLEAGSTATAYAPYNATSYPLDLGSIELCGIGDNGSGGVLYKDRIYKDGDDWKVHKAIDKHIFDGSESFTLDDTYEGIHQFRWNDTSVIRTADQNTVFVVSDRFRGVAFDASWIKDFTVTVTTNQDGPLRFMTSLSSTTEAFKAWLASNQTTTYFVLKTPTDTTITDQTLIAQLEAIRTASLQNGANTITNTATGSNLAGDMEIGYYGYNPTNRYDKFIWLDLNNAYEQLNNPDTSSTLSTRTLRTTTEQPTVTRSLETETITLRKGEAEPIEDKTGLPTIQDEETEEAETTEPEESDGTDER